MIPLEWNPQIGLSDLLNALLLLFTLAGLIFAGIQFRKSTKAQTAAFLLEIVEKFFSDEKIRKIRYRLDYRKITWNEFYDKIGTDDNEDEIALDDLLYLLDTIGSLVENNVISGREVELLAFQVIRIMTNPLVIEYLNWLDEQYQSFAGRPKAHRGARYLESVLLKQWQPKIRKKGQ